MLNGIINEFKDKKVLIWGFKREGKSTYNFIKSVLPNQKLYICDDNIKENIFENDEIINQSNLNIDEYDLVMKSPGIRYDIEKEHVVGQTSLFLKYFSNNTIGITGTKGKSTTSSLIYHILKPTYKDIFLVGNIGIPCFDILHEMSEDSVIVFEISCHQIQFSKYSPSVSVLLNLYQEHLDHYKSYEDYKLAKKQIVLNQKDGDISIINSELKNEFQNKENIIWADINEFVKDDYLINDLDKIEITQTNLIGKHNRYNMAIAYYITHVLYGISNKQFIERVQSFKTLPHRLENIGTFNNITYINDSISTIGQATIQAINSLKNVSTLLLGGMDRNIDYTDLISFLKQSKIDNVICMYDSGKRIYDEIKNFSNIKVFYENNLENAVKLSKEITKPNSICLLSPASASYGFFNNFEDRGEKFKEYVIQY